MLAPAIGLAGIRFVVLQSTVNRDALFGGDITLATVAIVVLLAIGGGGAGYARWLRVNRPGTWARIGAGDDPTAAVPEPARREDPTGV